MPNSNVHFVGWASVAALSQIFWGCSTGFLRFLAVERDVGFLVVAAMNGVISTFASSAPVLWKLHDEQLPFKSVYTIPRLFSLLVVTSVLSFGLPAASQLTLSIHVQMIFLQAPLFVALIVRWVLKKPLPRFTFPAIIFSGIGSLLGLFGEIIANPDTQELTLKNYFGFLVSLLTTISFAIYLVLVQIITQHKAKFARELLVWWQFLVAAIVGSVLATFFDDWSVLRDLDALGWISLLLTAVLCFTCANLMQLAAIRRLGSPFVGCLMPVRFVASIFLGASPYLNEELNTLNIVGSVIVILSVGFYLFMQYRESRQKSLEGANPESIELSGSDHFTGNGITAIVDGAAQVSERSLSFTISSQSDGASDIGVPNSVKTDTISKAL